MRTPINTGLLQSDIDFADKKPIGADLSDYAGTGMAWNPATKQFSSIGGTGLDANTVTADDIGLVGDGVTDNTAALQSWLNSVETARVSSTLLVPDGVYVFSGPLQDTGRRNAQILLPSVAQSDPQFSVSIKGYHPIMFSPWPGSSVPLPKGPVFKSTLATGGGTQPSFIGGMGPNAGANPDLSFMAICFENMILQTIANPLITCLNLAHYGSVYLTGDVLVIAGNGVGTTDSVEPTTSSSCGVIFPDKNASVYHTVNNLSVWNFYYGVQGGENVYCKSIGSYMCKVAYFIPPGYGTMHMVRAVDYWCTNGILVGTGAPGYTSIIANEYTIEAGSDGSWFSRVYDLDDATNVAYGDITWWANKTIVGNTHSFVKNGGTGVKSREIGSAYP